MVDTVGSALPAMVSPQPGDKLIVIDDPGGIPATQNLTFTLLWTGYLKGQADPLYFEVAGSGEISAIAAKATLVAGDFFIIEDSAAANVKKSTTTADIWTYSKAQADPLYFALLTAGQIAGRTQKSAPVAADTFLLNDSAAGDAVKYATLTDMLAGTGVAGVMSTKFSTDTVTTPLGDSFLMIADQDNVTAALKEQGCTLDNAWTNFFKVQADANQTTPNRQTGTTYTLALTDRNKVIEMNNASANTLTIPLNATVAFTVGDIINIVQYGAGITTVDGATSVTVNGVSSGGAAIDARYNGVSIHKTATDEWLMVGAHGTVA